MNRKQLTLLCLIVVLVCGYFLGGGDKLLNPSLYQTRFLQSPVLTAMVFFLVFFLGTASSLPVTGVFSVISGVIFGHVVGVPVALFASTLGGTVAYLISRYLLHNLVQQRFAVQLAVVNKGIEKEGAFYLFCLRMIPVIPFWVLNLLMGLTPISSLRFFSATLLGMLPVTLILVHFGTQLGAVQSFSLKQVFTPGLLFSLTLLATMPFLAKGFVALIRRSRVAKQ